MKSRFKLGLLITAALLAFTLSASQTANADDVQPEKTKSVKTEKSAKAKKKTAKADEAVKLPDLPNFLEPQGSAEITTASVKESVKDAASHGKKATKEAAPVKASELPAAPKSAPTHMTMTPPEPPGARVLDNHRVQQIKLQINKSLVLELPGDAKDILVSNPKIANAIVRSQRRVFIIGTSVGSTNVIFFDQNAQQLASIDLVVERDLTPLNRMLQLMFPNTDVHAEGIGENVVLRGQVNSAADVKTAVDIAQRFVDQADTSASSSSSGSPPASTGISITTGASGASSSVSPSGVGRIVNALTILGKEQIQLRVVVAEVDRNALKQIGVDLNGQKLGFNEDTGAFGPQGHGFSLGNAASDVTALNGNGGGIAAFALPLTAGAGRLDVQATIHALENTGISKILAEPNLTAVSGEEANFLAGGQVPIVTGFTTSSAGGISTPIVTFKDFGVGLAFNPVVLSEGRISIRVKTEVSAIDNSLGTPCGPGCTTPGFDTRKAETVLELPSGGSMMIAGLLRDDTKMAVKGIPALRHLPVLGPLFSSQEFQSNQTELVVIVTPYIVNPVSRRELSAPTDGFVNATEPDALLFGRFNKIYGVQGGGTVDPQQYNGKFGFIYE